MSNVIFSAQFDLKYIISSENASLLPYKFMTSQEQTEFIKH